MKIDNIPGAFWIVLIGGIYAGLQVFVSAQWPDAPPAAVLGGMTALGIVVGAVKALWPAPTVPTQAGPNLPASAAVMPMPPVQRPSAIKRFFF